MNLRTPIHVGAVLFFFVLVPELSFGQKIEERPSCEPFAVHRNGYPLNLWKNSTEAWTNSASEEQRLVDEITKINTYEPFAKAYGKWAQKNHKRLTVQERAAWLSCILFYAKQDTDKDGIPDWRAIIDAKPSRVLFPQDEDIDGDGTTNALDPSPFDAAITGDRAPKEFPSHLLAAQEKTAILQRKLYREFGILAIEHTGEHSPIVLENLMFLLRHGFGKKSWKLSTFRYIYAFSGHDTRHDMAAFHVDAKAISIGDRETYPETDSSAKISIPILSTLAHEIGHAFLFEKIQPAELKKISRDFGGWGAVFDDTHALNYFSKEFFVRHPLRAALRRPSPERNPAKFNIASTYALSNVHEWFADAFAASTLKRLGQAKLLGEHWERELVDPSKRFQSQWTNYNNISGEFAAWIDQKLRN